MKRSNCGSGYGDLLAVGNVQETNIGAFRQVTTSSSVDADVYNVAPRLAQRQWGKPMRE